MNEQDENIKYTMEVEDPTKSLQFLDLNIQNCDGCYKFKIHRKNAITNVQVKQHSGHDPKILKGIFIGFLNRAYTICEGEHLEEEIQFLIKYFTENGYNELELKQIENSYRRKRNEKQDDRDGQQQQDLKIVSLPWGTRTESEIT